MLPPAKSSATALWPSTSVLHNHSTFDLGSWWSHLVITSPTFWPLRLKFQSQPCLVGWVVMQQLLLLSYCNDEWWWKLAVGNCMHGEPREELENGKLYEYTTGFFLPVVRAYCISLQSSALILLMCYSNPILTIHSLLIGLLVIYSCTLHVWSLHQFLISHINKLNDWPSKAGAVISKCWWAVVQLAIPFSLSTNALHRICWEASERQCTVLYLRNDSNWEWYQGKVLAGLLERQE